MKKLILPALFLSFYGVAQDDHKGEGFESYATNTSFFKTPPIRSLLGTEDQLDEQAYADAICKDGKTTNSEGLEDIGIPENNGIDPALQTAPPLYKGKANGTKVSFNGLGGAFPPDPSGAAGPNNYVQGVNTSYRVYYKTGTSNGGAKSLSSLWPGSTSQGDPIIMYDRYAERWFISQFQPSSDEILIAISETSDPLGAYYAYSFTVSLAGSAFPDYPKFGLWHDGYYMSCNSSSKNCVIFERDKMLMGDQTAGMVTLNFPPMYYFFRSVAPAYAEGPTEPESTEPFYYVHIQDNSWSGVTTDHIKVLACNVDWTTPSNSSVTVHQSIDTDPFNSVFTNSWDDITQQGSSQKLDAVTGIFMYRVQYRRFDGYNVMMMCTTVDVDNTNRAGVRWFELRDNNDGNWSIYQQGTYSPDSQNSRWMGNIAMDQNGNIGLAYSFAGPNNYAGIRYTGRYKDDPLGQMTVQEQVAVEGLSAQTGGNRYGDYSQMTMDPENDLTFWFTGEYIGNSGSRKTRIFSFSSWTLLGQDEPEIKNPFFNAYQTTASTLTLVWNSLLDEQVEAVMYDMNGKIVLSQTLNGNESQQTFEVPGFAKGVYVIKLKGKNTNLSKKVYLS